MKANLSEYRLDIMCRVLEVTMSGFQSWRRRPASLRSLEDEGLKDIIQYVYNNHKGRYGVSRIQAELAAGRRHNAKRVACLMGD